MGLPFIEQLGQQTAGNVVGAGLGLALGGIERKNQLKQQQKLQNMQIAGQQQMGEFNRQQQMKMWNDTNYSAQMEQLKKAGLNPGLIYGMGGGAGGSTQANAGSVSGGQAAPESSAAGMGMQMGQAAIATAQIELMRAQANKTNVEAEKIGGVDTRLGETQIQSLTQGMAESKAKTALMEVETSIKAIDEHIKGETQNHLVAQIKYATQMMKNDETISNETMQDKIKQMKAEAVGAVLENYLKRAQTKLTTQQIQESKATIRRMIQQGNQDWRKITMEATQNFLKEEEMKGLFEDNDPVAELIDNILLIPTLGKGGPKPVTGFKTGGK